jgi:hypothetical protein
LRQKDKFFTKISKKQLEINRKNIKKLKKDVREMKIKMEDG